MNMFDSKKIPEEALRAGQSVRRFLGSSVVGVYLFGSAVVGGLRPNSDVDVLVVVNDGLTEDIRQQLVKKLMEVSGRTGGDGSARPLELTIIRLSDVVPWRYPPRHELLYGEWLRDEFEKGEIPGPTHNPDLAIILTKARERSIALIGPDVSEILDPVPVTDIRSAIRDSLPGLIEGVKGDERNVILTLARMWLTAADAEISPKDVAAEWAIKRLPQDKAALLDVARRAYLGECHDDWEGQASELMALVTHMKGSIKACLGSKT
jgi:aminoglycoside 9-adenylyltransferase